MGHEINPDALQQLISWLDEKVVGRSWSPDG